MAQSQPAVVVLTLLQHQCDMTSLVSHLRSKGPLCFCLTHWVVFPYLKLGDNAFILFAVSLPYKLACSQVLGLGCGCLWD